MEYSFLLDPLTESPPNRRALSSVTEVKVKESMGGGLSPVTTGENHSPTV